MMNQEVKNMWTFALRSGKYEQGVGRLNDRREKTFCCLGVLCEIAVSFEVCTKEKTYERSYYDGHSGALPLSVQEWAGISAYGELDDLASKYDALSEMNDSEEFTFDEIADFIDRTF